MNKAEKTKEQPFSKSVLADEIMEQGYYSADEKSTKPENHKSRKSPKTHTAQKSSTKPRSFGSAPLAKVAVEIPEALFTEMKLLVVGKRSRFNIETAAAFEMYIKASGSRRGT